LSDSSIPFPELHIPYVSVPWFYKLPDGTLIDCEDDVPLYPHLTPYIENIFTHGQCHALAVALHEILGWPIYGIFDSWGPDKTTYHYMLQCPRGGFADVTGFHCFDCGYRKTTKRTILAHRNKDFVKPAMEFARHYAPLVIEKLKKEDKKYGRVRNFVEEL
jgi:hypothetical protein